MQFAILSNEIMQGAFDLKVDEYKKPRALERENLRDQMADIELVLTTHACVGPILELSGACPCDPPFGNAKSAWHSFCPARSRLEDVVGGGRAC